MACEGFKFAVSLAYGPDDGVDIVRKFPDGCFSALELPEILLGDAGSYLPSAPLEKLVLADIMPLSLTRGAAWQTRRIIEDFKSQLNLIVRNASRCGVSSMTMDFAVDTALEDQGNKEALIKFIKEILPQIYKAGIKLCLPVRIPGEPYEELTEFYLNFIRELMFPCVRFAVNVHPHELGGDFNPGELLKYLKFDIDNLRFIYEPEVGNRLVPKLLEPWLYVLDQIGFNGLVTFCPRISSNEHFRTEIRDISEMLTGICQSQQL